ncbi:MULTISPECIES: hypothetical protein [Halobacteriovorax]|uniref:Lipoprotein n=1 Tax=Halobacteriovorax vibrionivorans TaxID=2152716 RepID=A0ABY0IN05_9BACT|nr:MULTISPECIES: hypothetical protein [Halobacteriovorax]AYF43235.1 putative lipoprotein [Halobacteriovorax sp. BALOs_7]RZF23251.1 hypothetical protein DAY19_05635 [Halobacteriovorax vibrionivorans]TGD46104.1 hypothetical protein EP118_13320 [Halobacteriovorax sp. Y22]
MHKFIIGILFVFLLGCQQEETNWQGGVDQNSNGIRDDIDTWIKEKAGDSNRLKKALETLAKVNPADCEYSVKAKCLEQLSEDGIFLQIELLELQLNTSELREKFEDNLKNCPRIDDRKINYKCDL